MLRPTLNELREALEFQQMCNNFSHATKKISVSMAKGKLDNEDSKTCLYEILGVSRTASDVEIKKAYRIRALQCHPDKNKSEESAKLNFQKLVSAYNILKGPDSRKMYDETGYIEGEGFDKAADFFRTKFGRISEQDIVDFEMKYKHSQEEEEDVKKYYDQNDGDISKLLEWIPLSRPDEVERFIEIVAKLLKNKSVKETSRYHSSVSKLRKNAIKMQKEEERFKRSADDANADMSNLVLAIKQRQAKAGEFLDSLLEKYAVPKKKKKT